jgi:fluoride ion exporter CrcB/FEX
VTRLFVDGKWVDALFALILGTTVALASFEGGNDASRAALAIDASRRLRNQPVSTTAVDEMPAELNSNGADEKTAMYSDRAAVLWSAAIFAALCGAAIVAYVVDTSAARRQIWLSCILAPTGALARWQLLRLNSVHAHVPVGTLAANALACMLDATVAALVVLLGRPDESTTAIALGAIITGCGGTLSTVSTWCGEFGVLRRGPAWAWAYLYLAVSFVIAQVVGIIVYGSVAWSRR